MQEEALTSELHVNVNYNDNSVAIFEANLEPNWAPVPVHVNGFFLTVDDRADKNNRKGLALMPNSALNWLQTAAKEPNEITVIYRSSLLRLHRPSQKCEERETGLGTSLNYLSELRRSKREPSYEIEGV